MAALVWRPHAQIHDNRGTDLNGQRKTGPRMRLSSAPGSRLGLAAAYWAGWVTVFI
jgi:hypothetical protein